MNSFEIVVIIQQNIIISWHIHSYICVAYIVQNAYDTNK